MEAVLLASAARTTNGNGSPVDSIAGNDNIGEDVRVFVDVTAVSGTTPSMTVTLQAVVEGVAYDLASSSAITATGQYTFTATVVPRSVQEKHVITGTTPSFTYSVRLFRKDD